MNPDIAAKSNFFIILILAAAVFTGCANASSPITPPDDFSILEIKHSEVLSPRPMNARDSQIAVNQHNGELFAVWARTIGDGTEIIWRHGQAGIFSAEEPLTEPDGIRSWNPSIACGTDGRLHLAWMDREIDGVQKETYSKSWDGSAWGDGVLLTMADGWTSWDPDIETYPDGRPVVAWFDHRFGVQHEILLRIGDGNGMWWPDVRLTNDDHWQYFPDMEIDNRGKVHLSYVDARYEIDEWENADHYAPGRNLEIFYRTWSGGEPDAEVRVTDTPLRSIGSHLAISSDGIAHVIFLDESQTGYWVLYYVKIDGGIVTEMVPVSGAGCRADIGTISCLDNRVLIVWPEYPAPGSPAWSGTKMYIREILSDGTMGTALHLRNDSTALHPSMAIDELREMAWIIWMNYYGTDESLIEGETEIVLKGISIGH